MTNKFHCGRLVTNKKGVLKKLALADGGGTRDCEISHIDIGLEEIHDRLREIFLLDQTNCNSKLYDFRKQELDIDRYKTFYEYIHQNCLQFKGTVLYLYTPADGGNTANPPSLTTRRTTTKPIQGPDPMIRRIPQAEADSSTAPIAIKTGHNLRSTNEPVVNNRTTENLERSSFSNYSFNQFHQNSNILPDQRVNDNTIHRQSTSYSSTNYLFNSPPPPSTYFSSSSSSSRYQSERDTRKRTYPSSSSDYKSTKDENNEKCSLFKNLLTSLHDFLNALHQRRFTSFYNLVGTSIGEIKSCRSALKLSNYQSLHEAEQRIISIENSLKKRINDEYHHISAYGMTQQVEFSFKTTLDSIHDLLTSFRNYKSQIDNHKRSRTTHYSSSIEGKPLIRNST